MNEFAINGGQIDGPAPETFQSQFVNGYAYAAAFVRLIGMYRGPLVGTVESSQSGIVGRALMRSPSVVTVAAVSVLNVQALVRAVLAATAQASVDLIFHVARAAAATAIVTARVLARAPVIAGATAQAAARVIGLLRSPVEIEAMGSAVYVPTVLVRHNIGASVSALAFAQAQVNVRAVLRSSIAVSGKADGFPIGRMLLRMHVAGSALALVKVTPDSFFNGPFDEPALPENTFVVQPEPNLFLVI